MPETPSVGAAYLYGFTDGSNHTIDTVSQRIGDLAITAINPDFADGYLYAIEEVLGILGQARK